MIGTCAQDTVRQQRDLTTVNVHTREARIIIIIFIRIQSIRQQRDLRTKCEWLTGYEVLRKYFSYNPQMEQHRLMGECWSVCGL